MKKRKKKKKLNKRIKKSKRIKKIIIFTLIFLLIVLIFFIFSILKIREKKGIEGIKIKSELKPEPISLPPSVSNLADLMERGTYRCIAEIRLGNETAKAIYWINKDKYKAEFFIDNESLSSIIWDKGKVFIKVFVPDCDWIKIDNKTAQSFKPSSISIQNFNCSQIKLKANLFRVNGTICEFPQTFPIS